MEIKQIIKIKAQAQTFEVGLFFDTAHVGTVNVLVTVATFAFVYQ